MGSAYSAVYDELKRAARAQLRRMRDDFQTTALVHEAYLKLGGAQLAAELEKAKAREKELEQAGAEASAALGRAIAEIKSALANENSDEIEETEEA